MRVYLPATFSDLRQLVSGTTLAPPRPAYAVTAALRAWAGAADDRAGADDDDEELELVALSEAGRHSLRLLGAGVAPRRVVLAADIPAAAVTVRDVGTDGGPGLVGVDAVVSVDLLAAVHVDDAGTADAVSAAARAVGAADDGDAHAEAVVAALDDQDLLWYDPSELPALVAPAPDLSE